MISAFRDVQIIAAAPAGIDLHAAKTKVSERGLNGLIVSSSLAWRNCSAGITPIDPACRIHLSPTAAAESGHAPFCRRPASGYRWQL